MSKAIIWTAAITAFCIAIITAAVKSNHIIELQSQQPELRTKTIQEVQQHFQQKAEANASNFVMTAKHGKLPKPSVSYWQDPEPEDEVTLDVMTESTVSELKFMLADDSIPDTAKAAALVKLSTIKCSKQDYSEAFDSLIFMDKSIRRETAKKIFSQGQVPAAKTLKSKAEELGLIDEHSDPSWLDHFYAEPSDPELTAADDEDDSSIEVKPSDPEPAVADDGFPTIDT